MSASLPMYDMPEIRDATDGWWAGLAAAFRAEGLRVPDRLTRSDDAASLWGAPDLMFSQTCGYPLTHEWAGRLKVLATPCYAAPGCEGASYRSVILVREDAGIRNISDLRGKTAAFNARDSLSGWLALRLVFAAFDESFFGEWCETGAHLASMTAVRDGLADVCTIDAVTYALARRHRPEVADGLMEIARSPLAPALPYVTRPDISESDLQRMRAGLAAAIAEPSLSDVRAALFLAGVKVLDDDAYGLVLQLERSLA